MGTASTTPGASERGHGLRRLRPASPRFAPLRPLRPASPRFAPLRPLRPAPARASLSPIAREVCVRTLTN